MTSLSTLTSSPDSYFGVMFSGRHDLKAMQCKDGSYFIDRDGTHFRFILNYLRNGEEMVESISRLSTDVALDLLCEAKFYQLDGLIKVLQREIDVITQDRFIIMCHAEDVYGTWYCSKEIVFKNKNMTELSLVEIKFKEAVSFINCNLSNSIFRDCEFRSDVIFKNCLLVNTMFIGLRVNSKDSESSTDSESLRSEHTETYNISFIDSNIERASFLRCTKYQWH